MEENEGGGKKKLLKANVKAGDIGQTLELDRFPSGWRSKCQRIKVFPVVLD